VLDQEDPGQGAQAEARGVAPVRHSNSGPVVQAAVVQAVPAVPAVPAVLVAQAGDAPVAEVAPAVVADAVPVVEQLVLLGVAAKRVSPASRSGQSAKNLR
jgi:hypothetical protein